MQRVGLYQSFKKSFFYENYWICSRKHKNLFFFQSFLTLILCKWLKSVQMEDLDPFTNIVNTMAADDLAMREASALTTRELA